MRLKGINDMEKKTNSPYEDILDRIENTVSRIVKQLILITFFSPILLTIVDALKNTELSVLQITSYILILLIMTALFIYTFTWVILVYQWICLKQFQKVKKYITFALLCIGGFMILNGIFGKGCLPIIISEGIIVNGLCIYSLVTKRNLFISDMLRIIKAWLNSNIFQ